MWCNGTLQANVSLFDLDTFNMSLAEFLEKALGPKHLPLSTVLPLTLIYGLIFVTGVVGNISVCAVIVRNPSMHTATNYYLFSLAVSDLTLLILGLPNELSLYYQQYPWALGIGLCKFRALVSEMVSYTSVLTIVAFSMERYLAICHPLHHYAMSGLERAVKIIAVLWVVSLVSAAPFAVYTTINYIDYPPGSGNLTEESGICAMLAENVPPNWPIYEVSSILFFLLPMVVILILYVRMGMKIRKRTGSSLSKRLEGSVHETKHSNSKKAIIRMLAAVVIAFFLCWAPFHAQRVMYLYFHNCPSFPIINEWLYYIAGCLYYFSSTVNPILYNVMSAKYRLAFKETLCGFIPLDKSRIQRSWNGTNVYDESFSRTRSTRSTSHSVRHIRRTDHGENFKFGEKIELETESICENTNLISKYKLENTNLESENVVKSSIVVINPTAKKYSSLSRPSRWSKALLRVVRSKTSDSNNKFSNNVDHNSVDDPREKSNSHPSKSNSNVFESKTEVHGNSIRTFANMEGESSI